MDRIQTSESFTQATNDTISRVAGEIYQSLIGERTTSTLPKAFDQSEQNQARTLVLVEQNVLTNLTIVDDEAGNHPTERQKLIDGFVKVWETGSKRLTELTDIHKLAELLADLQLGRPIAPLHPGSIGLTPPFRQTEEGPVTVEIPENHMKSPNSSGSGSSESGGGSDSDDSILLPVMEKRPETKQERDERVDLELRKERDRMKLKLAIESRRVHLPQGESIDPHRQQPRREEKGCTR